MESNQVPFSPTMMISQSPITSIGTAHHIQHPEILVRDRVRVSATIQPFSILVIAASE